MRILKRKEQNLLLHLICQNPKTYFGLKRTIGVKFEFFFTSFHINPFHILPSFLFKDLNHYLIITSIIKHLVLYFSDTIQKNLLLNQSILVLTFNTYDTIIWI